MLNCKACGVVFLTDVGVVSIWCLTNNNASKAVSTNNTFLWVFVARITPTRNKSMCRMTQMHQLENKMHMMCRCYGPAWTNQTFRNEKNFCFPRSKREAHSTWFEWWNLFALIHSNKRNTELRCCKNLAENHETHDLHSTWNWTQEIVIVTKTAEH